ncbi:hypothetical protein Tco_0459943 [Tanacetum coccineum]
MVAFLNKSEGSEGFQQIFWQIASTNTLEDGEVEITATIDGQLKTITEASLGRHLKLEDADGISSLPNTEIFKQLDLMGPKKTAWDKFSSNIATAILCLATNMTFNFSKMIFEGMLSDKVLALEIDLQQTKKVYSTTVTKLIMKVKRLEKIVKSSKARRRAKIAIGKNRTAEETVSTIGASMPVRTLAGLVQEITSHQVHQKIRVKQLKQNMS